MVQLVTGPITQQEFETIFKVLRRAANERAMSAEMSEHLVYKHGEPNACPYELAQRPQQQDSAQRDGPVDIDVPRDREGRYEFAMVGKHERPV